MTTRDPSVASTDNINRARLKRRKINHVVTARGFAHGRISIVDYGATIGYWHDFSRGGHRRKPVLLIGPLQIGITRYWCGIAPNEDMIFIGRNGKLWRVPGHLLPQRASDPRGLDAEGMRIWSYTYEQIVLDVLCPAEEVKAMQHTSLRYRNAVKALVKGRVMDASGYGFDVDAMSYARGCCETWKDHDLLNPRHPTMQHALYVSLVLTLSGAQAAELIELAALIEYRIPLINRGMAGQIYEAGVQKLGAMCPAWSAQGYTLEWKNYGSIDRYFRREFARLLTEAVAVDVDAATAAGKLRITLPDITSE